METQRSSAERLDVIQQLVRAYADIHHATICHRDVKAENIVLTRCGLQTRIRLCDFSLAEKIGGGATGSTIGRDTMFTCCGTNVPGTACWIAPEVLRGDRDKGDG